MLLQLDLQGGEHDLEAIRAGARPLSPTQRAVLRHMRFYGNITSTQAGVIAHAGREMGCGEEIRAWSPKYQGSGCCQWASSDGSDVMKRMLNRGLAKRHSKKGWVLVHR